MQWTLGKTGLMAGKAKVALWDSRRTKAHEGQRGPSPRGTLGSVGDEVMWCPAHVGSRRGGGQLAWTMLPARAWTRSPCIHCFHFVFTVFIGTTVFN